MINERKRVKENKNDFLCSNKIIISVKEARKIIGKKDSDKISDEDLARLIGMMYKVADGLISMKSVPKIKRAV